MVPIDDLTNFDEKVWTLEGADAIDGGFEFAAFMTDDDDDYHLAESAAHNGQNKCYLKFYDPFDKSDARRGKCRVRETPKAIAKRMKHYNEGVGADENRVGLTVYPPEIAATTLAPTSFYGPPLSAALRHSAAAGDTGLD